MDGLVFAQVSRLPGIPPDNLHRILKPRRKIRASTGRRPGRLHCTSGACMPTSLQHGHASCTGQKNTLTEEPLRARLGIDRRDACAVASRQRPLEAC
jgi:hypothetical protein